MSQLYCCGSSRSLVFSAIISVLICQAASRHRFSHINLLREQQLQEKSLENSKEVLPKLLRLFLKTPSINHHNSGKLNHRRREHETTRRNFDNRLNTTCGRKNCENIPDYPSKLIADLFAQQTRKFSLESGPTRNMARSFGTDSVYLPAEMTRPDDDDNRPRNKEECERYAEEIMIKQNKRIKHERHHKKGSVCDYQIQETYPQESIDENNNPVMLVVDGASIIIKGLLCTTGVDCTEGSIPNGHSHSCVPYWEYHDACVLNDDKTAIVRKNVAIESGCNCTRGTLE